MAVAEGAKVSESLNLLREKERGAIETNDDHQFYVPHSQRAITTAPVI